MGTEFKDERDRQQEAIRKLTQSGRREEILGDPDLRRHFLSDNLDPTMLKHPDPAKRYKLVNKEPRRMARFEAGGYVKVPHNAKTQLPGRLRTEDGGQTNGDNVLMETPVENFERRLKRISNRQKLMEQANIQETRDNINRIARDEMHSPPHRDAAFIEESE
jgi:hypothetical protein